MCILVELICKLSTSFCPLLCCCLSLEANRVLNASENPLRGNNSLSSCCTQRNNVCIVSHHQSPGCFFLVSSHGLTSGKATKQKGQKRLNCLQCFFLSFFFAQCQGCAVFGSTYSTNCSVKWNCTTRFGSCTFHCYQSNNRGRATCTQSWNWYLLLLSTNIYYWTGLNGDRHLHCLYMDGMPFEWHFEPKCIVKGSRSQHLRICKHIVTSCPWKWF